MKEDKKLGRRQVNNSLQWVEISLRMLLFLVVIYIYGEWLCVFILKEFDLLGETTLLAGRSITAFFSIALMRSGLKFSNKKWRKHVSSILITLVFVYLVYFTWSKAWPFLVQT
ncbi:MAG: hypothetical protein KAG61_02850 [Bacteriovoracaceae bacterium]|nr:hypothetical protein [Bacteriovoracaceae bacterium]